MTVGGGIGERALVLVAQEGDATARAQLVESLRPLIATVARTYRGCPAVGRSELMQEGVVGLLRALEHYDPDRNTPFWAYAAWWVRQAMQRLVAELGQPVVLSDRALRQLARIKNARLTELQRSGQEPSSERLAATTGLSREQVDQLLLVEQAPRSLDDPVSRQQESATTLGALLGDPSAEDGYERVVDRVAEQQQEPLLDTLSEREQAVVRERYGFDGPQRTLRQIGGSLELSPERVRQIEQRALDKLRVD